MIEWLKKYFVGLTEFNEFESKLEARLKLIEDAQTDQHLRLLEQNNRLDGQGGRVVRLEDELRKCVSPTEKPFDLPALPILTLDEDRLRDLRDQLALFENLPAVGVSGVRARRVGCERLAHEIEELEQKTKKSR